MTPLPLRALIWTFVALSHTIIVIGEWADRKLKEHR